METIKPAAALSELETPETEERTRGRIVQPELRALSDYELWLVGGGDGIPEW